MGAQMPMSHGSPRRAFRSELGGEPRTNASSALLTGLKWPKRRSLGWSPEAPCQNLPCRLTGVPSAMEPSAGSLAEGGRHGEPCQQSPSSVVTSGQAALSFLHTTLHNQRPRQAPPRLLPPQAPVSRPPHLGPSPWLFCLPPPYLVAS